jgi:uncharacterized membrane protein YphA (DoxX/SURF4 family)
MARKIVYWVSTIIVAGFGIFAGASYLTGSAQVVQGFAHVGYPDQLRVELGVAKILGGITLLVPGLARLKEWAYAGFTFAWIAAHFAHHHAGDPVSEQSIPLILLAIMFVSYFTRQGERKVPREPKAATTNP